MKLLQNHIKYTHSPWLPVLISVSIPFLVSDIVIFVLNRDVKLLLTNYLFHFPLFHSTSSTFVCFYLVSDPRMTVTTNKRGSKACTKCIVGPRELYTCVRQCTTADCMPLTQPFHSQRRLLPCSLKLAGPYPLDTVFPLVKHTYCNSPHHLAVVDFLLTHNEYEWLILGVFYICPVLRWHDGATSRALDLRSTGRGFKPYSGQTLCNNLGQVVHTHVPLSNWPK